MWLHACTLHHALWPAPVQYEPTGARLQPMRYTRLAGYGCVCPRALAWPSRLDSLVHPCRCCCYSRSYCRCYCQCYCRSYCLGDVLVGLLRQQLGAPLQRGGGGGGGVCVCERRV